MAIRKPSSSPRKGRGRTRVVLAAAGLLVGSAAGLARRAGLLGRLGFGDGGDGTTATSVPVPAPLSGGELTSGNAGSGGPHEPAPSNYDVGGPPANTATHVPVPPPAVPSPIDEEAEAAAAAAEAAGIGGEVSPYASSNMGAVADEVEGPLVESGEGTSEGFEQALAEQVDAASPWDTASPYEKQIDEAIDQQDNPFAGESSEMLDAVDEAPVDVDQPGDDLGASSTGASSDAAQEDSDPGSWSERDDRP